MSDVSNRLDAIQLRIDRAGPGGIAIFPSDVAWLLETARKQDAQLDAVRELAKDAAAQPLTELAPVRIFAGFIRKALEAKP